MDKEDRLIRYERIRMDIMRLACDHYSEHPESSWRLMDAVNSVFAGQLAEGLTWTSVWGEEACLKEKEPK